MATANPQAITEEMGVHNTWYEEAEKQTLQTLPTFLEKLATAYQHDYGTICHAVAASAIAAAWAMERSPSGGITGFQSGCVMWEFIRHWCYSSNKMGLRLVDYDQMLYPQYREKFTERTISRYKMDKLQEEAKRLLSDTKSGVPQVRAHWQSIADGIPPFGYRIIPD